MKLSKSVAMLACTGLLWAGTLGSAHYSYAQDSAEEIDQNGGAWTGPAAGSASSPDKKHPPLDIAGCWDGTVNDEADGGGDASFVFVVSGSGKKITGGGQSAMVLFWPDTRGADSPIKGIVGPNGFKFSGPVNKGCKVKGSGTGTTSEMTGKVQFKGDCKKTFKDVTFSIVPGICACR